MLFLLLCLQTIAGEYVSCLNSLKSWVLAIPEQFSQNPEGYGAMVAYSGKHINDMGLYYECLQTQDANYVVFQLHEIPSIVVGMCLPKNCTEEDYWEIIQNSKHHPDIFQASPLRKLQQTQFELDLKIFIRREKYTTLDTGACVMLVFVCTLLGVCLVATGVDYSQELKKQNPKHKHSVSSENSIVKEDPESVQTDSFIKKSSFAEEFVPSKGLKVLLAFSLYSNSKRLFEPKQEKSTLDILNAMRVLSILWVILGHSEYFRLLDSVMLNLQDVESKFKHFNYTILFSGPFAVDTFFWIGGFLQSYILVQRLTSKGSLNWLLVVFHRLLRIVPLFLFVICLSWSLAKYIGDGPKWYNADQIMHRDCSEYWWTFLLFVNNFVMPKDRDVTCLVGAWYIPNDMQFFLASLPVFYLYCKKNRLYGWGVFLAMTLLSVVIGGIIAYDKEFNVVLYAPENITYMRDFYYKPYCRVGPYCIGALAGFVYFAFTQRQFGTSFDSFASKVSEGIHKSTWKRYACYASGLFLINLIIFVQYNAYQDMDKWTRIQNTSYFAFSKVVWGFGLSLVFLPMLMGHNKLVAAFLQSDWWTVLARLTFGVYLVHMVVGQIVFMSQPTTVYFSQINGLMDALFLAFMSFVVAVPLNLMIESPVINLEKLLIKGL